MPASFTTHRIVVKPSESEPLTISDQQPAQMQWRASSNQHADPSYQYGSMLRRYLPGVPSAESRPATATTPDNATAAQATLNNSVITFCEHFCVGDPASLHAELDTLTELCKSAQQYGFKRAIAPVIELNAPLKKANKIDVFKELSAMLEEVKYVSDKRKIISQDWERRKSAIDSKLYEKTLNSGDQRRLANACLYLRNAPIEQRRQFIELFTGGAYKVDGQCGDQSKSRMLAGLVFLVSLTDNSFETQEAIIKSAFNDYVMNAYDLYFWQTESINEKTDEYIKHKSTFLKTGAVNFGNGGLRFSSEDCLASIYKNMAFMWQNNMRHKSMIGTQTNTEFEEAVKNDLSSTTRAHVFDKGSIIYDHCAYQMLDPLLIDEAYILTLLEKADFISHSPGKSSALQPRYAVQTLLQTAIEKDAPELADLLIQKVLIQIHSSDRIDAFHAYLDMLPPAFFKDDAASEKLLAAFIEQPEKAAAILLRKAGCGQTAGLGQFLENAFKKIAAQAPGQLPPLLRLTMNRDWFQNRSLIQSSLQAILPKQHTNSTLMHEAVKTGSSAIVGEILMLKIPEQAHVPAHQAGLTWLWGKDKNERSPLDLSLLTFKMDAANCKEQLSIAARLIHTLPMKLLKQKNPEGKTPSAVANEFTGPAHHARVYEAFRSRGIYFDGYQPHPPTATTSRRLEYIENRTDHYFGDIMM